MEVYLFGWRLPFTVEFWPLGWRLPIGMDATLCCGVLSFGVEVYPLVWRSPFVRKIYNMEWRFTLWDGGLSFGMDITLCDGEDLPFGMEAYPLGWRLILWDGNYPLGWGTICPLGWRFIIWGRGLRLLAEYFYFHCIVYLFNINMNREFFQGTSQASLTMATSIGISLIICSKHINEERLFSFSQTLLGLQESLK